VELGHRSRVRASQGKCYSIGLERGQCRPDKILTRWFHKSFLGNPIGKPEQLDASPHKGA
jgi:hypothetical protein